MATFRADLDKEYQKALKGTKKSSDIIDLFQPFKNNPTVKNNVSYRMEYKDGRGIQELFGNHGKAHSVYRNINAESGNVKIIDYRKG